MKYWWLMRDILGTFEIVWRLDGVFTRGERARERKTEEVSSISATVTEHNFFPKQNLIVFLATESFVGRFFGEMLRPECGLFSRRRRGRRVAVRRIHKSLFEYGNFSEVMRPFFNSTPKKKY